MSLIRKSKWECGDFGKNVHSKIREGKLELLSKKGCAWCLVLVVARES